MERRRNERAVEAILNFRGRLAEAAPAQLAAAHCGGIDSVGRTIRMAEGVVAGADATMSPSAGLIDNSFRPRRRKGRFSIYSCTRRNTGWR